MPSKRELKEAKLAKGPPPGAATVSAGSDEPSPKRSKPDKKPTLDELQGGGFKPHDYGRVDFDKMFQEGGRPLDSY